MAAQRRREIFIQTNSGSLSRNQSTKRPLTERHGHEEWKQRIDEDWQNHLEILQQYMAALLGKNQQPGMTLAMAIEPERGYKNGIHRKGCRGNSHTRAACIDGRSL